MYKHKAIHIYVHTSGDMCVYVHAYLFTLDPDELCLMVKDILECVSGLPGPYGTKQYWPLALVVVEGHRDLIVFRCRV